MHHKTIIIGGGMAGMSCALKLLEAGQDFLLITDRLGGRIMYAEEAQVNFGAYFIMSTYTHAKKVVTGNALIKPTGVCFHNSDTERFAVLSAHTLGLLPEFARFYFTLREFSAHYESYKRRCLTVSQKAALEADPYMADIFSKPASQFIREKKFEQVASDYISKFTYACTGAGTDQLTALDFLNVSMGILVPIHSLIFDAKAMTQKLGAHLVIDTIESIQNQDTLPLLIGKSGQIYLADKVVVATPAFVTKDLLTLAEIRSACRLYVFHVKAELKRIYTRYDLNLFPNTSVIMLTARQHDGSYMIYSRESEVDLHQVCQSYTILSTMDWEKAMYIQGSAYMEQQYGDHIYVAGDHNGLGLEPAAISGIYAANQIIKSGG